MILEKYGHEICVWSTVLGQTDKMAPELVGATAGTWSAPAEAPSLPLPPPSSSAKSNWEHGS